MPPPPIAPLFAAALAHQQAGRLEAAADLYRQVLDREPGHVDSLHLLGIATFQQGCGEDGAALIRRAAALAPARPDACGST